MLPFAADYLVVQAPLERADAIFVFGGDPDPRAEAAARLVKGGWAPEVVLIREEDLESPAYRFLPDTLEPGEKTMLASSVWKGQTTPGDSFEIEISVADGDYAIYPYLIENYKLHFRRMDLFSQGIRVAEGIGLLPLGGWRRYGPFPSRVQNGKLTLAAVNAGSGDPAIAGLEVLQSKPGGESFVLGINFAGPPVQIREHRWLSHEQAKAAGMRIRGTANFGTNLTDRAIGVLLRDGVTQNQIVELHGLHPASSTADEAREIATYVREKHLRKIIVVTSAYHTRRAAGRLNRFLKGSGVLVIPQPVGYGNSRYLEVQECIKLLLYSLAN
jgi:hypothetical protein